MKNEFSSLRKSISVLFGLAVSFLLPHSVYALKTDIQGQIERQGFFQSQLGLYITRFIELAFVIGAIAALAFLILGAIRWITSGGDKNGYEEARTQITQAVIGLGLLAVVWVLWLILLYFFGFNNLPQLQVPSPKWGS